MVSCWLWGALCTPDIFPDVASVHNNHPELQLVLLDCPARLQPQTVLSPRAGVAWPSPQLKAADKSLSGVEACMHSAAEALCVLQQLPT